MTDSNLLELAKLGDPQAIETLMNQSLQSRGMRATVNRQGNDLEVVLEAERIPNRQALTAFVQKGISNLGIQSIQSIRIFGQQVGASEPNWMQELQIGASLSPAMDIAPLNIQPEISSETPTEITTVPGSDAAPAVRGNDVGEPLPPAKTAPDFLQDLLAEEPPALLETSEQSDEELLDFLNELSGTPASEDFPAEVTQDQTILGEDGIETPTDAEFEALFTESPTSEIPLSDSWITPPEAPPGEPDADLLDFLNEPALESTETFDQSSDLSSGAMGEAEASPLVDGEAAALDPLPDLYDDGSDLEMPLEQPSEEFLVALLGESPPVDNSPLDAGEGQFSSQLEGQIEELFASEMETETEPFIEESWPEQPPDGDEDLQQAWVNQPMPAPEAIPNLDAVREPWMEGTEDGVVAMPEGATPSDAELDPTPTPADLTSADFDLPQPETASFWSNDDGDVEEIPPDFLLDFQDDPEFADFLPAPQPPAEPWDDPLDNQWGKETATEAVAEPWSGEFGSGEFGSGEFGSGEFGSGEFGSGEFGSGELEPELESSPATDPLESPPDISSLPSLEAELAALELSPLPLQPAPASSFDSLDADLADLLSETPEGTLVEPTSPAAELMLPHPDPVIEDQPETPSEAQPNVSQDSLEAGLGEFREGFVEPLPQEFLNAETHPAELASWQTDLRQQPLELDDDEAEAGYIIEENTPEYTPPPLPPSPTPDAPSSEPGPSWLFTTVLVALCVLIGGLLGFSLFWSRVSPPSSPPADQPPADQPPAVPPAPAPPSPSSANPASPSVAVDETALEQAIDRASDALTLSQAAQSVDDWGLVASKWQQAIGLLRSVPNSSPDYAAAQQRLADYQANLAIAQGKANQPILAAVPLGQANIKAEESPTNSASSPAAVVACSPVASTPTSQPVELSRVQFDPAVDQAQPSPIVGCITNHTEQPIATVNVAYGDTTASDTDETPVARPAREATGKLNFAQLNPKQTIPFKSEFTLAPSVKDVRIAAISWTAAGEITANQLPAEINVVRTTSEQTAEREG